MAEGCPVYAGNPAHPLVQAALPGIRILPGEALQVSENKEVSALVYVAVGNPWLDDPRVPLLLRDGNAAGWEVTVRSAPSILEVAQAMCPVPEQPWAIMPALNAQLPTERPVMAVLANSPPEAVRAHVRSQYPRDHAVHALRLERVPKVWSGPLHEVVEERPDVLWLPALSPLQRLDSPETLRWIMARLRAPDGCPWDKAQTHETLKENLREETAEVLDALATRDSQALCEELGDLLLQVYFHAQIAEEEGNFTFDDVVRAIGEKLVRRHSHVFGNVRVESPEQALANWERIKHDEHQAKGTARKSLLDGIPRSLPALAAGQALGEKAAKVGFDWPDLPAVLAKVREELEELLVAETTEERAEELGDVLFVLCRVASWLGVDAEEALRAANRKFRVRFAYMEEAARQAGRTLDSYTMPELDRLWSEAKHAIENPWGCPR
jgi:tetrapyrrole methylase family protein/MazG family protein